MNGVELREAIGGTWENRYGAWSVDLSAEEIRPAAAVMLAGQARFAAIVALPWQGGARLAWYWDVDGALWSVRGQFSAKEAVPSILDLYPGADWAEWQASDCCGVMFEDTPCQRPPSMPAVMAATSAGSVARHPNPAFRASGPLDLGI